MTIDNQQLTMKIRTIGFLLVITAINSMCFSIYFESIFEHLSTNLEIKPKPTLKLQKVETITKVLPHA